MKEYLHYLFDLNLNRTESMQEQLTESGADVLLVSADKEEVRHAMRKNRWRRKYTLVVSNNPTMAQIAHDLKLDFCGICTDDNTNSNDGGMEDGNNNDANLEQESKELQLQELPHRQILHSINQLPLLHRATHYRATRLVPKKFAILCRLIKFKQIRGRLPKAIKDSDHYTCPNCGTTYHALFCPRCGQSCHTPRFSFKNIASNFLADYLSLSNAFTRNFVDMFYRPGYMIRDYIEGKRMNYHRPFSNMFVLATLYLILAHFIDPQGIGNSKEASLESLSAQTEQLTSNESNTDIAPYLAQIKTLTDSAKEVRRRAELNLLEALQSSPEDPNSDVGTLTLDSKEGIKIRGKINSPTTQTADTVAEKDSAKISVTNKLIAIVANTSLFAINTSNQFDEKFYHQGTILYNAVNLLGELISNNKAFSWMVLIPLFAFSARRSFRGTLIGRRLNMAEYFLVFSHFGGQLMWVSIFTLLITQTSSFDITTDLGIGMLFAVWDLKQLFNTTWSDALKRTLIYMNLNIAALVTAFILACTAIMILGILTISMVS